MSRTAEIRRGADFGHALAEVRRARGLTQVTLAEQAGISRTYLATLEAGRTTSLLDHYVRALRRAGATITVTFPEPVDGQG